MCPNQEVLQPKACDFSRGRRLLAPNTCELCWGDSDCCADFEGGAYSDPTCKSSGTPNCPSGDTLCNGGNCPASVACDYEGSAAFCTQGSKCWGRLTCSGGTCPPGYEEGQFCFQDGGSANFKVCCDKLPEPPAGPAPAPEPAPGEHSIRAVCDSSVIEAAMMSADRTVMRRGGL